MNEYIDVQHFSVSAPIDRNPQELCQSELSIINLFFGKKNTGFTTEKINLSEEQLQKFKDHEYFPHINDILKTHYSADRKKRIIVADFPGSPHIHCVLQELKK